MKICQGPFRKHYCVVEAQFCQWNLPPSEDWQNLDNPPPNLRIKKIEAPPPTKCICFEPSICSMDLFELFSIWQNLLGLRPPPPPLDDWQSPVPFPLLWLWMAKSGQSWYLKDVKLSLPNMKLDQLFILTILNYYRQILKYVCIHHAQSIKVLHFDAFYLFRIYTKRQFIHVIFNKLTYE